MSRSNRARAHALTSAIRLRRRLLVLGFLLFVAFIFGASGSYSRYDRIVYGALPLALALVCFGGVAWIWGIDIAQRDHFDWRGRRFTGREVPFFGRAWMAFAFFYWALGAGIMAVWLWPSLAGASKPETRDTRAHVAIPMTAEQIRRALFAELQPIDVLNCRLERFGEPHDGGYLMCANLLGSVKAGYSYGISGYDQWGCDVARKLNVRVHQYDCFNLEKPVCADGVTVFHGECVAPSRSTDDAGRVFDNFEHQFASNGDGVKRVVVKIDVEGAEWDTFLQTPPEVFERIDQLVVEFHGVDKERYLAAVRRLKEFFVVANLHINNYACQKGLEPFPAWAYEALFVNKRIAVTGAPRPAGAHALDAPNKPTAPDCQVR